MTLGATEITAHPAALLVALWAALTGKAAMLLTAFGSILLHEGAHAAAAALAGVPPVEIELTPLGALMRLEDEERLPPVRRMAMLAAGPAMTLLLCGTSLAMTKAGWLPVSLGRQLFAANLSILMINLLPALPLDGGRMLALILSGVLRPETQRRVVRGIGMAAGLLCVAGSVWISWWYGGWNLSLAAAGCFLMYSASAATTTRALEELRRLMDRKIRLERRGHAPLQTIAVMGGLPLQRAIRLLPPGCVAQFVLIGQGTMQRLGVLADQEAIGVWLDHPGATCLEALQRVQKGSQ